MARGNRREPVFLDDDDYAFYLKRLALYQARYTVMLHAYCLMPNHVHLVTRTTTAPLDRFMQCLQQSYTQWYNRRHGQVGHVFQGRYKALPCTTDEYLVTLVRYVHLNPVRAGLVTRPEDYRFSAHRAYLAGDATGLVDPAPVLRLVGGAAGYARLVDTGEAAGEPEPPRPPAASDTPGLAPAARLAPESMRPREPLDRALSQLARALPANAEGLRGPDRSHAASRARTLVAFVLIRRLGYRVGDVAAALGRDGTTLTVAVGRLGHRLAAEPAAAQEVERLVNCMEVKA
jgi:REP-associated tyrosine transposase